MPQNNDNKLKDRINYIKVLKGDFPEKETISDLTLFHLLDIFSYRKDQDMAIFTSLEECIQDKAQDNDILLYLFLDTFTNQEKKSFLDKMSSLSLEDSDTQKIREQISTNSLSTSPNPPIYKGWGVRFNQGGISTAKEDGTEFLLVKIDEIFSHSKLENVEKGNTIKITLTRDDINNLKNNGKFDVGEVAKLIRNQKSLTIQKNAGINLTIEEENKNHFYKGEDDKYIGFLASLDMSEEKVKEQERAIKKAFGQKKEESLAEVAKQSPKGEVGGEASVAERGVVKTPSGTPLGQEERIVHL